MRPGIHQTLRARRLALGLSQIEVARRSGIQQRQVSTFERGGDVTLSTLAKLAQALDMELLPVPREDSVKVAAVIEARAHRASAATAASSSPSPSLLDRYQVTEEEASSNG